MHIDFEKVNNKWYVVKDDYKGDPEDLEMVDGADTLLDFITLDDKTAGLEVYEEEPSIDEFSSLDLIDHDDFGATYKVNNCAYYDKTVWLCNVAHLYFHGEHPEHIYFTLSEEY